ncbi:MAG: hypothetical protein P0111_13980 [Nitrospira sp.]|nr:hypothetical protein [Nitrospira sp.]
MQRLLIFGVFTAVLFLVSRAQAELDGNGWMQQSEEFKRGYAAGHLDTLTVLGTSLLSGGTLSAERARTLDVIGSMTRHVALCVRNKSVTSDQLKTMTDKYLHDHPTKAKSLMFITAGSALGQTCPP